MPKRFLAIDLYDELFPRLRENEVAALYLSTQNKNGGYQWSLEQAPHLFEALRKYPLITIALFDRQASENSQAKLIGALFAQVGPGPDGLKIVDWGMTINDDAEYGRLDLARELKWLGQIRFREFCKGHKISPNQEGRYTNLRIRDEGGIVPFTNREGYFQENVRSGGIRINYPKADEFRTYARFMSDENTYVTGEEKWNYENALLFLKFMDKYKMLFMVAERQGEILGLASAYATPANLTDMRYFRKHGALEPTPGMAHDRIGAALFDKAITGMNAIFGNWFGIPVYEIGTSSAGSEKFFTDIGVLPHAKDEAEQIEISIPEKATRPGSSKIQYIRGFSAVL